MEDTEAIEKLSREIRGLRTWLWIVTILLLLSLFVSIPELLLQLSSPYVLTLFVTIFGMAAIMGLCCLLDKRIDPFGQKSVA